MILNNFNRDHLLYLSDYYNKSLAEARQSMPAGGRSTSFHMVMDYSMTLALVSYALEKPLSEVKSFLSDSLSACVSLFNESKGRYHTPIAWYEGLCLALILDKNPEAGVLLSKNDFPGTHYDDGSFVVDEVIMKFISALACYLSRDNDKALKIAEDNLRTAKNRTEVFAREFSQCTLALISIIKKDQQNFQKAIQEVVSIHAAKARNGSLREEPKGLLSLNALALAGAGLRNGLTITAGSEYLPLGLLKNT